MIGHVLSYTLESSIVACRNHKLMSVRAQNSGLLLSSKSSSQIFVIALGRGGGSNSIRYSTGGVEKRRENYFSFQSTKRYNSRRCLVSSDEYTIIQAMLSREFNQNGLLFFAACLPVGRFVTLHLLHFHQSLSRLSDSYFSDVTRTSEEALLPFAVFVFHGNLISCEV